MAERSQRLVAGDPRLVADATSKAMPSPAEANPQAWSRFWRKWPLDRLARVGGAGSDSDSDAGDSESVGASGLGAVAGSAGALVRYSGDDFVPTFTVAPEDGDVFDAMVAEIVDWRLADYLLRPKSTESDT